MLIQIIWQTKQRGIRVFIVPEQALKPGVKEVILAANNCYSNSEDAEDNAKAFALFDEVDAGSFNKYELTFGRGGMFVNSEDDYVDGILIDGKADRTIKHLIVSGEKHG